MDLGSQSSLLTFSAQILQHYSRHSCEPVKLEWETQEELWPAPQGAEKQLVRFPEIVRMRMHTEKITKDCKGYMGEKGLTMLK